MTHTHVTFLARPRADLMRRLTGDDACRPIGTC
jgi:hypothetical protein